MQNNFKRVVKIIRQIVALPKDKFKGNKTIYAFQTPRTITMNLFYFSLVTFCSLSVRDLATVTLASETEATVW